MNDSRRMVDVLCPDGRVVSMQMVIAQGEAECYGFWDSDARLWREEIRHRDSRVERFIARIPFGERFEDNP